MPVRPSLLHYGLSPFSNLAISPPEQKYHLRLSPASNIIYIGIQENTCKSNIHIITVFLNILLIPVQSITAFFKLMYVFLDSITLYVCNSNSMILCLMKEMIADEISAATHTGVDKGAQALNSLRFILRGSPLSVKRDFLPEHCPDIVSNK